MAEEILRGLNTAQRAAVASPAAVLQILAPPGSGKTKTLTARVAYLLRHNEYKPENIIVATFTVKAAREMKERLGVLLGDGLESKLVLGTFHSIARRYLVRYGPLIGLRRGFGIADTSDSVAIIKRIIKRQSFHLDANSSRNKISSVKAKGRRQPEQNPTNRHSMLDQREFLELFDEYENALQRSNLLDYDDLLLRSVELLQKYPKCVSNVEAVLIDEFQDTNLVQFELMKLFANHKRRVTIVGDPDQSIYGFRYAEIKNLQRMRNEYPDAMVCLLEENYRSSGAILLAALEVIQQDTSRPKKNLLPTHCVGTRPVLRALSSAELEASWIVSEIRRSIGMTGGSLSLDDFAILLRSAYLSRHIELALGKAGIPYKMVGGNRFFERVEVKIVIDYLRVISQPDNNDAMARIINVPPRRIGDVTVKKLFEEAEVRNVTMWSLIQDHIAGDRMQTKITKGVENAMGAFVSLVNTARDKLAGAINGEYSLHELIEYVLETISFEDYLKRSYPQEHESRWANIQELTAQATEFSNSMQNSLYEEDTLPAIDGIEENMSMSMDDVLSRFLANLALSTETNNKGTEEKPWEAQVTISTIHAAKGLEWPAVFVPGAYSGSIPHSRAENTDEERRLLYVAMTRAKALLYLSYPQISSQGEPVSVSSFLDERKLKPHFQERGPRFEYESVQSICRILGRVCPPEDLIEQTSQGLESKEHETCPANSGRGGTSALYNPRGYLSAVHQNDKKRPIDQNPARFTSASLTMTPGFISAGAHLRNITDDKLNRAPAQPAGPPSKRVKAGNSDGKAPSKGPKGRVSKAASQSNSTSKSTEKGATTVTNSNGTRATRSNRGTQALSQDIETIDLTFDQDDQENELPPEPPAVPVRGASQICPYPFTGGHRLRIEPRVLLHTSTFFEHDPKPKPYPFLSSSPRRL
ncbi:MAG: hypothetical protein M1816_000387 [Peltula sp. TS41687]|nr:MAG: hypothetical protein M1816_000387 [Peltula sp. TS41687]